MIDVCILDADICFLSFLGHFETNLFVVESQVFMRWTWLLYSPDSNDVITLIIEVDMVIHFLTNVSKAKI